MPNSSRIQYRHTQSELSIDLYLLQLHQQITRTINLFSTKSLTCATTFPRPESHIITIIDRQQSIIRFVQEITDLAAVMRGRYTWPQRGESFIWSVWAGKNHCVTFNMFIMANCHKTRWSFTSPSARLSNIYRSTRAGRRDTTVRFENWKSSERISFQKESQKVIPTPRCRIFSVLFLSLVSFGLF